MSLKGIFSNLHFNPGNRDEGVSEAYVEDEVAKIKDEDVEIVLDNEEAINKKFSGANTLSKYAELGKIMVGMLKDVKNGVYPQVPWFTVATVVLALLYVVNPMDIIPDFIPGIGYIDDMAVLSIGVGWIESDLHRYLDWKIQEGKGI
ncbi:YkvA family protein [Aequorivita sp. SDUM287046]|uniref:YkvA family protein n=1 Tax=Aequorivita aurantiaca TaxID=3053356 RepID=A0ABT8DJ97_9FLAO|nr:YkvA family protein [Aequorivita aurantiaca]MDN3725461.1 YkvA family protein [Aequorivita aurantiaca]